MEISFDRLFAWWLTILNGASRGSNGLSWVTERPAYITSSWFPSLLHLFEEDGSVIYVVLFFILRNFCNNTLKYCSEIIIIFAYTYYFRRFLVYTCGKLKQQHSRC